MTDDKKQSTKKRYPSQDRLMIEKEEAAKLWYSGFWVRHTEPGEGYLNILRELNKKS